MRVMSAVTLFLLMAATAARSQKDVVAAWSETAPASANGALVLLVARMHGVLPREALRQTNWLTSAERSGRLGRAAGLWIGIAVAAIAILAWRKRRAQSA